MAILLSGSRSYARNLSDLNERHALGAEVESGNPVLESAVFATLAALEVPFNPAFVRAEIQACAGRPWLKTPKAMAQHILSIGWLGPVL